MRRIAAVCFAAAAMAGCQSTGDGDGRRWASLPHSFGCQAEAGDLVVGPGAARIRQMRFSHVEAHKLQLDVQFAMAPPAAKPRMVRTPFGVIDAPGTIHMDFLIHPSGLEEEKVIAISSPSMGSGWRGDISEFDSANPNVLASMSDSGTLRTFVLDLAPMERQLGQEPFQADVAVVVMVSGQPDATGAPNLFPVRGSDCNWAIPAPETTSRAPTAAPIAPPPAVAAPEPSYSAPLSTPPIPVSGADIHGFLDNPGARCDNQDHAAMLMRTAYSLAVVCRSGESGLYYKGLRLSDSAAIRLDGATSTPNGYTVTNPADGTRYELTTQGLVITVDGQQAAAEDALQSAFL